MLRESQRSAFIDFCIEHEILGLLRAKAPNYWARQLEEPGVAKTIEDQETYLQRLFDALDLVDHALDGVPVVLLKNGAICQLYSIPFDQTPMGDLDLLVEEVNFEKVCCNVGSRI